VVAREPLVFIKFERSFLNNEKIEKIKSSLRKEESNKKRLKTRNEKLQR
jgi:hypothetical protein